MVAQSLLLTAGSNGKVLSSTPFKPCRQQYRHARTRLRLSVRSEDTKTSAASDDEFEAKIAALRKAKGSKAKGKEYDFGEGQKRQSTDSTVRKGKKEYDYSSETLYFESGPHLGDLGVNVVLGATLLWLPLTFAALGRSAFVKYRFTDKRMSVITTAPWNKEQLDAAYQEVIDIKTVGRGIGIWGDMVVTLRSGDKVEMRAVPRWQELKKYILERRDALTAQSSYDTSPQQSSAKGFL